MTCVTCFTTGMGSRGRSTQNPHGVRIGAPFVVEARERIVPRHQRIVG